MYTNDNYEKTLEKYKENTLKLESKNEKLRAELQETIENRDRVIIQEIKELKLAIANQEHFDFLDKSEEIKKLSYNNYLLNMEIDRLLEIINNLELNKENEKTSISQEQPNKKLEIQITSLISEIDKNKQEKEKYQKIVYFFTFIIIVFLSYKFIKKLFFKRK